jgi:hypothetical protein
MYNVNNFLPGICTGSNYNCGDECIDEDLPCNGVCLDPDSIFCEGKCISKTETLECNGECQHIDKPCNGVCQQAKHKCGKQCLGDLAKGNKWECNGECQNLYESCNEVCPTVGNVSNIQERYFKCFHFTGCFSQSTVCYQSQRITPICPLKLSLPDKLCNKFLNSNSTFRCPKYKNLCKQSRQCISTNDICNGVMDCLDRSDESLCPENLDIELDFSIFKDCQITQRDSNIDQSENGFNCGSYCIPVRNWCRSSDTINIVKGMRLNISDCPQLLKTFNNEKLCQNFTFWSNRSCPQIYKRFEGNYPGKCIEKGDKEVLSYLKNFRDHGSPGLKTWLKNFKSLKKYKKKLLDDFHRKCKNNITYIKEELWCDGYTQCPDGSDEDLSDCGKCPRTYGFPKGYKHATFSCKHKYTGRPICAIPCDGKDDLCLDDVDEQCSSASVKSTLLFGTLLVIISLILGELYLSYVKKNVSKKRESFQITMGGKKCLWNILECCSDGHLNSKRTFAIFKKSHTTEKYATECVILYYTLGLVNGKKAQDIAKQFYDLECKYHHGKNEDIVICIRRNFGTNENTKLLFELISQPPLKTHFFRKWNPKEMFNFLKTKYIESIYFLLLVSAKLFAYYADVYKDIYVIVEYAKLLPVDNLNLSSFGFQVFILLIVSVTLPVILNLSTLHQANEWSNLQSRIIHIGTLIVLPIVPALAVYVTSKLYFVSQRIKIINQNKNKHKIKNSLDSITALSNNDNFMQQTSTLLSDLRSNENATEHFIQSLVLILLIALKFTKSGTVSGFQELLAGNSNFIFLISSAVWSVFSIISGFTQRKIIQKNHSMPFSGIMIQLSYATLSMICRISACVIFFAPAIGLLNLLWHWKMTFLAFASYAIYDAAYNGTLIKANDVWKIKPYYELTHYQLDVYYIVFLCLILFHFLLVAAIKITCSKHFKSKKDYQKKMLHILHQGDFQTFDNDYEFI